jgi:hypothetical protein
MSIYDFSYSNRKKSQNILDTAEKIKNDEIKIEEILLQNDLLNEINLHSNSLLTPL